MLGANNLYFRKAKFLQSNLMTPSFNLDAMTFTEYNHRMIKLTGVFCVLLRHKKPSVTSVDLYEFEFKNSIRH